MSSTYAGFIRGKDGLRQVVGGRRPLSDYENVRIDAVRGDTYDSAFVDEVLTRVTERVINRTYQPHPLLSILNFDNTGGPGLAATKYFQGDAKASWARMGDRSNDLPTNAETLTKPITQPVESYWSGYEVWLRELERYQRAGSDVIPRKALAVAVGYLDLLIMHSLIGDHEAGIDGIATSDQIRNTGDAAAADVLTTASTAAQLFEFLKDLAKSIPDESASIYGEWGMGGYAICVPASMKRECDATFFGIENSENSVTHRLKKATGFDLIGLQRLEAVSDVALGRVGTGTTTTSLFLAGSFSPQTHVKQVPVPYQELPPHVDNLGFRTVTPSRCDLGGVEIHEPNAFAIRTGYWSNT
ncbi:MAG: DUF2184 domain-containing protein [bacterium]|nr:DUF2184 domain-containing protein [bacterium]